MELITTVKSFTVQAQ